MITELIGWAAATILLLTLGRQVWTQWRDRVTKGVSRWLFVGQVAASTCFVIYSWLLENWVFVVTNVLILVTAGVGEVIYLRNRRLEARKAKQDPAAAERSASQRTMRA